GPDDGADPRARAAEPVRRGRPADVQQLHRQAGPDRLHPRAGPNRPEREEYQAGLRGAAVEQDGLHGVRPDQRLRVERDPLARGDGGRRTGAPRGPAGHRLPVADRVQGPEVTPPSARPGSWYPLTFGGLVCAVFGWNVYRAATLGITHDEAVTYQWFVAGGLERSYSTDGYEADNHVLYSLLAWAGVRLFRPSGFALRLPSVLAGPLLLIATGRLFWLLAGSRVLSLIGLVVVALNPLVMDFQVAARGYGLGLALSVWAWHELARSLVSPEPRRLLAVAICQGLAVGANLVYAFPNFALGAAFLVLTVVWAGPARPAPL